LQPVGTLAILVLPYLTSMFYILILKGCLERQQRAE